MIFYRIDGNFFYIHAYEHNFIADYFALIYQYRNYISVLFSMLL